MGCALLNYLAYGSNMHPRRLARRVPSSHVIDRVCIAGYQLRFHKIGHDHSSKCNMFYTGRAADHIYGIVYQIRADERVLLDEAEGLGKGYELAELNIDGNSEHHRVFSYMADGGYIDEYLKPFDWYKQLVLSAAMHHGLPQQYVRQIQRVESMPDPDRQRALLHFRIAEAL